MYDCIIEKKKMIFSNKFFFFYSETLVDKLQDDLKAIQDVAKNMEKKKSSKGGYKNICRECLL